MQNWFPGPMGQDRLTKSALRQTAEQFHILVDSVEEYAIYLLEPTGNIVTWNTGAEKIKQYTAEEIIGQISPAFILQDNPRNRARKKRKSRFGLGRFQTSAEAIADSAR